MPFDHDNEDFQRGLRMGRDNALRFRCDVHSDLYQDVFKAETAEYKIHVSYDDPNGEYDLYVEFKGRYNREGRVRCVNMTFGSSREAIERAILFVTEHPAPRAQCHVDY